MNALNDHDRQSCLKPHAVYRENDFPSNERRRDQDKDSFICIRASVIASMKVAPEGNTMDRCENPLKEPDRNSFMLRLRQRLKQVQCLMAALSRSD